MRAHLASLVDDFRAHAAEIAVVEHRGVRSYGTTYGELAALTGRFAAELERRGVQPGERVLLWGANSAAWIAAFFGCVLRGVLVVPLDAAGTRDFTRRVIAEVSPRLLVGDAALLGDLATADHTPTLALDGLRTALPPVPDFRVDPSVTREAAFQIVFTSGTTSEPKGIVHTHANVLASLEPIETEIAKYRQYERWVHPLRFLHTLPLSHVFGQFMGLWVPAVLAAELHFVDGLEAAGLVRITRRARISVLVAVPRVLQLLRAFLLGEYPGLEAAIERAGNASTPQRWWRFRAVHRRLGWKFWAVIAGGASLPADLEQFWNRLGFALIQGYGMTETAALVTLNHPFHVGRGTIGKALPGREVKLSESGELLVRGDMVANATWQHGRMQPRAGEWLATGDLAEQNEAGEFRFVGRAGDRIVTAAGLNVYPADLETALLRQPGVLASVAVACDLPAGTLPVAVVQFRGDDAAMQQALAAANAELAEFQRMRDVLRWPEVTLPFTATGKLLRRVVRDWACAQLQSAAADTGPSLPAGRGATSTTPRGDALLAAIGAVTGEPLPTHASDTLRLAEDLHLDSLGRVQLATEIEQRTGILLADSAVASLATLGDLREAIRTAQGALVAPAAASHQGSNVGGSRDPAQGTAGVESSPQQPTHETPDSHPTFTAPELAATPQTNAAQQITAVPRNRSHGELSYPNWPWFAPFRWLRSAFVEAVVRPLVSIFLHPQVRVEEPPPTGPILVIANHVTALDGALVLYALPGALRRHVAVMMSGEMLADFRSGRQGGPLGWAAYWLLTALFNVFPLPRLAGFRDSFAHAGEALDRGMSVLIFPEGTRSRSGEMAPFRKGIGLLAAQAGVAVLPVALVGLDRIRDRRVRWFRSGVLRVYIGEALAYDPARTPEAWAAELEERIRTLLADAANG